jgi:hypothetical protein
VLADTTARPPVVGFTPREAPVPTVEDVVVADDLGLDAASGVVAVLPADLFTGSAADFANADAVGPAHG